MVDAILDDVVCKYVFVVVILTWSTVGDGDEGEYVGLLVVVLYGAFVGVFDGAFEGRYDGENDG